MTIGLDRYAACNREVIIEIDRAHVILMVEEGESMLTPSQARVVSKALEEAAAKADNGVTEAKKL